MPSLGLHLGLYEGEYNKRVCGGQKTLLVPTFELRRQSGGVS